MGGIELFNLRISAINYCFDDVNQVRIKSAGHNSRIILQLISGDTEYKDKTLKIIQSFARSINYSYRQLFILMCKHIFEKKDVWEKDISPLLVDLAYDKIINVRISLAKFIYKVINKNNNYAHNYNLSNNINGNNTQNNNIDNYNNININNNHNNYRISNNNNGNSNINQNYNSNNNINSNNNLNYKK